jgi:prepilin-type N-terminal cleavage/methylation domain-containing protein
MVRSSPSSSQSGFALIEVIVSAAVLALISLAVLSGIDGAQRATGREKARSVAATLAEQEQETLRSQQFDTLVGYATTPPAVKTVPLDGVNYQVKSEASWQVDSTSGTNKCASSSTDANYLLVTSTVTSPVVGTRVAPVKISSLVAPSVRYSATHGSLGVKIGDRNNAGVAGISVSTGGQGTYTGITNADGCVLFANIPIGVYTVTVNTNGYVNPNGDQLVVMTDQEVVSGSVTVTSITYDRAAQVTGTFETYPPNATDASTVITSSKAPSLSAVNGTVVGLLKTRPNPVTTALYTSIQSPPLFPFITKYAFFSGACEWGNPANYDTTSPAFSYWNSSPTPPGQVLAQPGNLGMTVAVRQPPLLVNINKRSGNALITGENQVQVVAIPQTPSGDDCADQSIIQLSNFNWTGTGVPTANSANANGWIGRTKVTISGKTYPESGIPFGKYKLCFEDTQVNPHKKLVYPDFLGANKPPYDNTKPYAGAGVTSNQANPLVVNQGSNSWTAGTC